MPNHADSSVRIIRVGLDALPEIRRINSEIFHEERIINRFDRPDLIMLLALVGDAPAGFKVGYGLGHGEYYSAKGGVLGAFRRKGVARLLLHELMDQARDAGYKSFAFDTFPNKHAGMTVLALSEGFRVVRADFHAHYNDYRIRLEISLEPNS
jgi:GNAT superfamily N-acetyltransferase